MLKCQDFNSGQSRMYEWYMKMYGAYQITAAENNFDRNLEQTKNKKVSLLYEEGFYNNINRISSGKAVGPLPD